MKVIPCVQGSVEWFVARRGMPTASEFKRICTPKKGEIASAQFAYACELIAETVDPFYGDQESFVSAAMKQGMTMEPAARRWYEMVTKQKVQQVGFVTTDDGRYGCSPDALVGEDGGLEIKSPQPKVLVETLAQATREVQGWLPEEYLGQVHGSLIITGRKWWDFCMYFEGLPTFRVRVVPDKYTDKVRTAMAAFDQLFAQIKLAVPVTPIPMLLADAAPEMSQAKIDLAAMGGSVVTNAEQTA